MIQLYKREDLEPCLEIFDSNTPPYFDVAERSLFNDWLLAQNQSKVTYSSSAIEMYYVYLLDGKIVGCAGYYVCKDEPIARMAWGMVHREQHYLGIGSALLLYRIKQLQEDYPAHKIELGTSQFTFAFFEKLHFVVKKITPNGYGLGIDKYEMAYELP